MDKIDTWIKERFGTTNTYNRQLLDNFIEFLEKELGYVIKDPDQSLPTFRRDESRDSNHNYKYYAFGDICEDAQRDMLLEHWVKVKEKSNV